MSLPEQVQRILRGKASAHLALVDEKGLPHASPLWVDLDDDGLIVINTAEGRVKARLLQLGAPVAISASDPENFYLAAIVRGTVVERTHEGALEEIDRLSWKYRGRAWVARPGQQRVTVRIRPERVIPYDAT